MKRTKQIAALLIVLIFSFGTATADSSIFNLDNAIVKAISNSSSIKAQDNSYEDLIDNSDDTGYSSMDARDLLNLDGRFAYLEQKKDKTFEEQLEYQEYKLGLGKPMTEEEKLPLLKARDISPSYMSYYMSINRNTRKLVANQIESAIYEQYNSLMKSKDAVEIQKKLTQNLDKSNQQAQLKFKLGKLSKVNARFVEISYQKSKLELAKAQRKFDMTLINLNKTIGEPLSNKYSSYSSDNMADIAAIKSYEEYLSSALKNRAEIANAETGHMLKKMEYDLTKVAYPVVTSLQNKDAKYYLDEAYNKWEETKIDIEMEITSAYSDLEKKLKSWENADKLYQAAEYKYKEASSKYSLNMITEKELTDATISLAQSELQSKNCRRDLWMQQKKLNYAIGIGPGIKSYGY